MKTPTAGRDSLSRIQADKEDEMVRYSVKILNLRRTCESANRDCQHARHGSTLARAQLMAQEAEYVGLELHVSELSAEKAALKKELDRIKACHKRSSDRFNEHSQRLSALAAALRQQLKDRAEFYASTPLGQSLQKQQQEVQQLEAQLAEAAEEEKACLAARDAAAKELALEQDKLKKETQQLIEMQLAKEREKQQQQQQQTNSHLYVQQQHKNYQLYPQQQPQQQHIHQQQPHQQLQQFGGCMQARFNASGPASKPQGLWAREGTAAPAGAVAAAAAAAAAATDAAAQHPQLRNPYAICQPPAYPLIASSNSWSCANPQQFLQQQQQQQHQQQQHQQQQQQQQQPMQYMQQLPMSGGHFERASNLLQPRPLQLQQLQHHQQQQQQQQQQQLEAFYAHAPGACIESAAHLQALQELATDLEDAEGALIPTLPHAMPSAAPQSFFFGCPAAAAAAAPAATVAPAAATAAAPGAAAAASLAPAKRPRQLQKTVATRKKPAAAKAALRGPTDEAPGAVGLRQPQQTVQQREANSDEAAADVCYDGATTTGAAAAAARAATTATGAAAANAATTAAGAAAAAATTTTVEVSRLEPVQVRALYLLQRKKAGDLGAPKQQSSRNSSSSSSSSEAQATASRAPRQRRLSSNQLLGEGEAAASSWEV